MTTIQVFALIGVFLIGAIFGGYATYKFFRFALRHSKVVGLEVGTCEEPECKRLHIRINTMNATESLGISTTVLEIDPGLGNYLIKAFDVTPPGAKPPLTAESDTAGGQR